MGYKDEIVGAGSGNWLGLDGEAAQNLPWGEGEPNVASGSFDCAAVEPTAAMLGDTHCRYWNEHVCMRR